MNEQRPLSQPFCLYIEHTRVQYVDDAGEVVELCVAAGFHAGLGTEEPEFEEPISFYDTATSDQGTSSGHSYVQDLIETDTPDETAFSVDHYFHGDGHD